MSIGIQEREGQFMHASGMKKDRTIGSTRFVVLIAGAYNAGGMIGPEMNGIAVLNATDRCVVLDQHLKSSDGGYHGPSKQQVAEFERVMSLSDKDFLAFCRGAERFRKGSMDGLSPKKPADKRTLMQLHADGLSYDEVNKAAFAAEGQRLLRKLAKEIGLPKGSFEISFNAAGVASSGDHTLHAERFYLTFNGDLGRLSGYYRTCDGRKDYGGGPNRPFDPSRLYSNLSVLAHEIKRHCLTAPA